MTLKKALRRTAANSPELQFAGAVAARIRRRHRAARERDGSDAGLITTELAVIIAVIVVAAVAFVAVVAALILRKTDLIRNL